VGLQLLFLQQVAHESASPAMVHLSAAGEDARCARIVAKSGDLM
jgi:hypothetical protein